MKSNEMKRLIFLLHWFLSFICKSFVYFSIFVNQNVQNIIKIGRQPSLENKEVFANCFLFAMHYNDFNCIFFLLWLHSLNPSIIKVCNLNVSARARISFHSTADLKAADKLSGFFLFDFLSLFRSQDQCFTIRSNRKLIYSLIQFDYYCVFKEDIIKEANLPKQMISIGC